MSCVQDEQTEWGKQPELTPAEIQKKVKEYNAQINGNLFMTSVRRCLYFNITGTMHLCLHIMSSSISLI